MLDSKERFIKKDEFEAIALLLPSISRMQDDKEVYYFIGRYVIYSASGPNTFLHIEHMQGGERKLLTQEIMDEIVLNEQHLNSGLVHQIFRGTLTI